VAYHYDTELVSTIIGKLEHGKAQDIDGLCVEHLYFCHPVILVILAKVFQDFACFRWIQIFPFPNLKSITASL